MSEFLTLLRTKQRPSYTVTGRLLVILLDVGFALVGIVSGFLLGYFSIGAFTVIMATLLLFAWYGEKVIKRVVLFRFSYEYHRQKVTTLAAQKLLLSTDPWYAE